MLKALLKTRSDKSLGCALCEAIGERARAPVFFTALGVPDTIDGRFDLVLLHAWMVLGRLRELQMKDVSQAVVDTLFVSFDESLRDLGVGDIGIGHRMKKMADAFYGRLSAYDAAADESGFKDAVQRNIFRGESGHEAQAETLARYILAARAKLQNNDFSGGADFGPLPAAV